MSVAAKSCESLPKSGTSEIRPIGRRAHIYRFTFSILRRLSDMPKPASRLIALVEAVAGALWLGLLDSDTLNEITWLYYMSKSGFEEEEFNIQHGFWDWERNAIEKHFQGHRRVLVTGAGGGREVIALARMGHQVTAVDFSPFLTAACRLNVQKAGCQACVLDALPNGLPDGLEMHDALVIGRGFYHHIPGREHRIRFLKDCHSVLKSRAPILISDFFTRAQESKFHQRTQTIANTVRRLRRSSERVEPGDWLTSCWQHAFTREEIEHEFREAGITLEFFAVTPFSKDSHLAHAVGHAR
jgi:SAM-dependent methyltransferase